jgi:hypothetical protein
MATGRGGALGWYPSIVVVATSRKEEDRIAWMIRKTMATSTMWTMTLNGDDDDAIAEEGF